MREVTAAEVGRLWMRISLLGGSLGFFATTATIIIEEEGSGSG